MMKKKEIQSTSVELIPVKCPKCKKTIRSGGQDIFFYCDYCDVGYELSGDKLRPVVLEFKKYRGKLKGEAMNIPFWAFRAKLIIHLREASHTATSLFSELGKLLCGKIPGMRSKSELTFYVPAHQSPPDKIASLGRRFTINQPVLEDSEFCEFEELAYNSEDAAKLADYIFLSSEIEKPDVISRLKYTLELKMPKLMVVSFE